MSWDTAVSDLRNLLNDNTTDRYCYRKRVFGDIDGTNTRFKTFEFRRLTDFTNATDPTGIFFDGVLQNPATVLADDVTSGEFTLAQAPSTTVQRIEATYYYHWYLDPELQVFLMSASSWLGLGTNYVNIPDGLRPGALNYAAKEAVKKQSLRWFQRASETFLLEDAPKKEAMGVSESLTKFSDFYSKEADKLRKTYYTRQDQYEAPNFQSSFGSVRSNVPRR